MIGEFLGERHGDLPWPRDGAGSALRHHVSNPQFVVLSDCLLNVLDGDHAVVQSQQITQRFFGEIQVDGLAHELRGSDHPAQGPFQLAHVGADSLGDEQGHVVLDLDVGETRFAHQNGGPGFQLRWFDSHR